MIQRAVTEAEAWAEEEELKEKVYGYFEDDLKKLKQREARDAGAIGVGEEKYEFAARSEYVAAQMEEGQKRRLYGGLSEKPYFAHLEIRGEKGNGKPRQYLLSDNELLDSLIPITSDLFIVPFRQDERRPAFSELFRLYATKKEGSFKIGGYDFRSSLLRDVMVEHRELAGLHQFYPELSDVSSVEADEMLAGLLDENRSDPRLKNIIASLQQKQFNIIGLPVNESFVVQGCAGSGKTQCLIHRLFYLRGELDKSGWQKVLLITPTQLFRNYSLELMNRYKLKDIANLSLAVLYQKLLAAFDPRFKNRQYEIRITEEYLPDAYLSQVYDERHIRKIEDEIERAIEERVTEAWKALNFPIERDKNKINARVIEELIKRLDDEIERFDRADPSARNMEFEKHRNALEEGERKIELLLKQRQSLEQKKDELDQTQSRYESLKAEVEDANREFAEQREKSAREVSDFQKDLTERIKTLDSQKEASLSAWSDYRHSLGQLEDAMKRGESTLNFLKEICALAEKDMSDFTKGKQEKTWLRDFQKRQEGNETQLEKVNEELRTLEGSVEEDKEWIRDFTARNTYVQDQRQAHRDELERAKNLLNRLESGVFEQEVWRALVPLKEQYGIKTLKVESSKDGRQTQTRILYKSDLLFYLKIYLRLHNKNSLPEYTMICIDEGQDLHSADYALLKGIYPKASFNVFGDTAQALHESCGVKDWKDTGIQQEYVLDTNYRNTAAVVDFCNQEFQQSMKYIGKVKETDVCRGRELQQLLKDPRFLKDLNAVIVRDREALLSFASSIKAGEERFEFLDTTAEKAATDRIPCYSIFAAKGLEFANVLVYAEGMTGNQKTVACTRATRRLYYLD